MAVETLSEFYGLMRSTIPVRRALTEEVLASRPPSPEGVARLRAALSDLEAIPEGPAGRRLALEDGGAVHADLGYEVGELGKDLRFLEQGEEALLAHLAELHTDFNEELEAGVEALGGDHFQAFVTDRDGTVNNYCGRYVTSVQSVYNAVFLTRFTRARARRAVIVTSAPLIDTGLADITVTPPGVFTYAGSKGREYLDPAGRRRQYPIAPAEQHELDALNEALATLLKAPGNEIFTLIGSGLQHKFGQTTIARQDIGGSVSEAKSARFAGEVRRLVREFDPEETFFRIVDTGLDLEILLTVEDEASRATRDFDKGDGLRLLNTDLQLEMERGTCLVCGDTASDVPLLEAALDLAPQTRGVFVTRDEALRQRVKKLLPGSFFVSEPDTFVSILNTLGADGRG